MIAMADTSEVTKYLLATTPEEQDAVAKSVASRKAQPECEKHMD